MSEENYVVTIGTVDTYTEATEISDLLNTIDIISSIKPQKVDFEWVYHIHLGTFTNKENANKLIESLEEKDIGAYIQEKLYTVYVGKYQNEENAINLQKKLEKEKFSPSIYKTIEENRTTYYVELLLTPEWDKAVQLLNKLNKKKLIGFISY